MNFSREDIRFCHGNPSGRAVVITHAATSAVWMHQDSVFLPELPKTDSTHAGQNPHRQSTSPEAVNTRASYAGWTGNSRSDRADRHVRSPFKAASQTILLPDCLRARRIIDALPNTVFRQITGRPDVPAGIRSPHSFVTEHNIQNCSWRIPWTADREKADRPFSGPLRSF